LRRRATASCAGPCVADQTPPVAARRTHGRARPLGHRRGRAHHPRDPHRRHAHRHDHAQPRAGHATGRRRDLHQPRPRARAHAGATLLRPPGLGGGAIVHPGRAALAHAAVSRASRLTREANGACGDLGTFLPYAVGAVTVGGLSAVGVFFGFGIALIAAGLFYGMPMAVQPMKALSAGLLTSGLTPGEVAMAGLLIGATVLLLGITGGVAWIARHIPPSVTLGLTLGLGLSMVWLGATLMTDAPLLGAAALAFAVAAMFVTRLPLLALGVVAVLAAPWLGLSDTVPTLAGFGLSLPQFALPAWSDLPRALELAVLPQMPLTLSNAIIVTAAVSATLFHE